MKLHFLKTMGLAALAVWLGAAISLHAQQRGGGFGGFGGGGGNRSFNNNSSSSGTFNNNGTVGSATITVDPETHNIVVIADEETAMQISNILMSLDVAKPQVLIKVVFVELQRNNSLDLGIEGGWTKGFGNSTTGSVAQVMGLAGANSVITNFSGMGQAMGPALTSMKPNGFAQIVGPEYQATIKAIATAGKAQVLSRPSVLARDGQKAQIFVGQRIYLPTGVTYNNNGFTTSPTINGTYQTVGIELDVTPFIGQNSLVQMILQPQISSVDTSTSGQIIAGAGLLGSTAIYAPNLNTRTADTVVITPDGEPVVIGGLIGDTKSEGESKIPLLGDIPVFGRLFRSTSKSGQKSELLMFLTPHIIREPGQLVAMSTTETRNTEVIATNGVSEAELNRFLDRLPVKDDSAPSAFAPSATTTTTTGARAATTRR